MIGFILAQTIRIGMVWATGQSEVGLDEVNYIYRRTKAIYRQQLGVIVRRNFVASHESYISRSNAFLDKVEALRAWEFLAPVITNRKINLVIDGPILDNGLLYVSGIATGTCRRSGAGVVNARGLAVNRLEHTVYAAIHELGHLFGAEHDNALRPNGRRGIMDSNALADVSNGPLSFSPHSKSQIRKCGVINGIRNIESQVRSNTARSSAYGNNLPIE